MTIEFPPGWGKEKPRIAISVPYRHLDDFIDAVKAAGWPVYRGLKDWANNHLAFYFIHEGTLHGSRYLSRDCTRFYELSNLILPEADTADASDFLDLL